MHALSKGLKKQLLIFLMSGLLLIIFLVSTQPLKLSLPVLLIPFIVFAVWVRSGVLALGMAVRHRPQPTRKLRVAAGSLAAVLLLVVSLQSLGQLSWRDVMLVVGLIAGLALYFYKTDLI